MGGVGGDAALKGGPGVVGTSGAAEVPANTFGAAVHDFCHASKPDRQQRLRHRRYMTRALGVAHPPNGGAPEIAKGVLADIWVDKLLAEINDVDVTRSCVIMAFWAWGRDTKASRKPVAGRCTPLFLFPLFKWLLDERWPWSLKTLAFWCRGPSGLR